MDWGSQQSLPPLEVVMFVIVSLVLEFRFGGAPAASESLPVFALAKTRKHVSVQCLGDECGEMLVDWFSSGRIRLEEFIPGQLFCDSRHLGNSS